MKTVENRYKRNQNDRGNIRFSRQTWEDFYKCSAGKNVYLFGAGNACDEFLYEYAGKVNINGILENDIQKVGKEKEKLPIILYSDFQAKKNDTVILITSIQYDDEIRL